MQYISYDKFSYDKFSYDKFYFTVVWTCQHVYSDKFTLTIHWPIVSIKCSDYFDKFSLLTHTDEQNLYFDKFFYDKCTCSKASMSKCTSVIKKIVKVARTDEQIKLVT